MPCAGSDRRASRWRTRLGVVLALAIGLAAPAEARERAKVKRYYVAGLVAPAVLDLHQGPSNTSPRVGQIPPDGRGLNATGRGKGRGKAAWREVEYEGVRGWAPARFLKPEQDRPSGEAVATVVSRTEVFREDLVCVGAPPYWKLVIDRDGSVAGNAQSGVPEGVRAAPARATAEGRRKARGRSWSIALRDGRGLPFMTLRLHESNKCSDGVSADVYAYDVTTTRSGGPPARGCCNRLTLAGR